MQQLVELLKERQLTIASCESLTGGLFCSSLTQIPGVSAVLKGGVVTYWTEIKEKVVHVSEETVAAYGVVSAQTAYEMAVNVQKLFDTDVAVSFTGNAGPDVMEGKPAGSVYTCIAIKGKTYGFHDLIRAERNEVRKIIVEKTTERIKELLINGSI